jgi:XTP/dITP diphosphohydrolase
MPRNSVPERPDDAGRTPLVIATGNAGKLREFRALLEGLPFEIQAQTELGIESVEETGTTFHANALLKARHASRMSRHAAIADDSGLEVDALGGAPGVYSARYAGAAADDRANNAKLLAALAQVPAAARTARYRCVLVFVSGPDDPAPLVAEGVWEGLLLTAPRGTGGFGYDPLFLIPGLGRTSAELQPPQKNRLSHRGMALDALRGLLAARASAVGR